MCHKPHCAEIAPRCSGTGAEFVVRGILHSDSRADLGNLVRPDDARGISSCGVARPAGRLYRAARARGSLSIARTALQADFPWRVPHDGSKHVTTAASRRRLQVACLRFAASRSGRRREGREAFFTSTCTDSMPRKLPPLDSPSSGRMPGSGRQKNLVARETSNARCVASRAAREPLSCPFVRPACRRECPTDPYPCGAAGRLGRAWRHIAARACVRVICGHARPRERATGAVARACFQCRVIARL